MTRRTAANARYCLICVLTIVSFAWGLFASPVVALFFVGGAMVVAYGTWVLIERAEDAAAGWPVPFDWSSWCPANDEALSRFRQSHGYGIRLRGPHHQDDPGNSAVCLRFQTGCEAMVFVAPTEPSDPADPRPLSRIALRPDPNCQDELCRKLKPFRRLHPRGWVYPSVKQRKVDEIVGILYSGPDSDDPPTVVKKTTA